MNTEVPTGSEWQTPVASLAYLGDRVTALEKSRRRKLPLLPRHYTTRPRRGRIDRLPYGFASHPNDGDLLIADLTEMALCQEIVRLHVEEGLNPRQICKRLDAEGRTRRGGPWKGHHSLACSILARRTESR